MNQRMCDAFQRRGKARDWASDGRKAAKMVFGALQALGTIEQSFALVLVGGTYRFGSRQTPIPRPFAFVGGY